MTIMESEKRQLRVRVVNHVRKAALRWSKTIRDAIIPFDGMDIKNGVVEELLERINKFTFPDTEFLRVEIENRCDFLGQISVRSQGTLRSEFAVATHIEWIDVASIAPGHILVYPHRSKMRHDYTIEEVNQLFEEIGKKESELNDLRERAKMFQ